MRCELLSRTGEAIPVDLSAAIVAEGGRDTATVGVFHDLREEMRRDAELSNARQRLEEAEKTALVSELAGAAAHELNQPLTSVLGFSSCSSAARRRTTGAGRSWPPSSARRSAWRAS